MNAPLKQHLIDPEICIRCNTCEETCPVDAITHDNNNYVVDATLCNFCMDCIQPCPTGSIDNWRIVASAYSLEEQFSWSELPNQEELASGGDGEAIDAEVLALIEQAHTGTGGKSMAPASAAKPAVNLYNRDKAAIATVTGNYRLTHDESDVDVHHVILDFGETAFPVLEGQSIGIVPPGVDAEGKPQRVRLYSIASPRHGERPNTNNLALTVKREPKGIGSNYICDLKKGDKVQVTGPFGATFLMPNDPASNIIMICTGTGSAPFRGFTEWRRRAMPNAPGRMLLFFGARRPQDLPYFGPLQKVPETLLEKHLVYSRLAGQSKEYVQDRMRGKSERIAALLESTRTHVYICGLKGMEHGVEDAFVEICRAHGLDWKALKPPMRAAGRYHVETY